MSPLSVSPAGSAGVSPIAGNCVLGPGAPGMTSVLAKIHSRRFREYVITSELFCHLSAVLCLRCSVPFVLTGVMLQN